MAMKTIITNETYEARRNLYIEEHCPAPPNGTVVDGHERKGSDDCNLCADHFDQLLEEQNIGVEGDDLV